MALASMTGFARAIVGNRPGALDVGTQIGQRQVA